ncbi:MAG: hypothetical protein IPG86_02795 [Chitinophagaceae bacterium]|nr:hypothetical protein [Chitinophagaceae bacterium]
MPTKTIKGKIVDYEKIETYDEDGIKLINYWIKVNNEKYTLTLPRGSNVYFENNDEVILDVNENNIAIAGLCPKKGFKWGKTKAIDGLVQPTDRYEIAEGVVLEKRKEYFNVSGAYTDYNNSNLKSVITYTIILPENRFRVHETIGKQIKPNTDIVALTENKVAYIIKDKTNNKTYGKPRKDFIIALILWIAFNLVMIIKKDIFVSYTTLLVIGNLFFGIAFLLSFSGYLSVSKTMKLFNQMTGSR